MCVLHAQLNCAQIANELDTALLQPGPRDAKLAEAQLCAAALLAVQPDAFTYSSSGLRILRALAHTPLRRLTPETMRLSQFCWCWVSACVLLGPHAHKPRFFAVLFGVCNRGRPCQL